MKDHSKTPFENFEELARTVVNVPRSVVKKKLDEEKQDRIKRKRTKKTAFRVANGST
jgi:hypothetical protein